MTTAWEGGQCGPIQDQLRLLVAGKIDAAERQITDLATFAGELRQAAAALERHRPDGACDGTCGCVSDPAGPESDGSTIHAAALSRKPTPAGDPAIACTLSAASMQGRHPRRCTRGTRPRRGTADRRVDLRSAVVSTKKNAAIVGAGVAACAVCCAGPILGLLAAIGSGTAAGFAMFGTIAILVAAAAVTLVLVRRGRRAVICAAPEQAAAVPVELTGARPRG